MRTLPAICNFKTERRKASRSRFSPNNDEVTSSSDLKFNDWKEYKFGSTPVWYLYMRTMFSLNKSTSGSDISITGYDILLAGAALFLVSSGLFLLTRGAPHYHVLVFGLFFVTNIVNIIAVFFVLHEMAKISRSRWFRFTTQVLSLPILLFALLSTIDFFSFAAAPFFHFPHPINMMAVQISTAILGPQVLEQRVIGLTYVYLLPLQVIAYGVFLVMISVGAFVEKRKGRVFDVPPKLILSLVVFLVMALLAIGDTMFAFQLMNR